MPLDYDIRRPTLRCAAGDRALQPGEPYVSALVDDGREVLRMDFAASAWIEPPKGAIGWWRCRAPTGDGKPQAAPRETMLALLDRWADDPAEAPARYLLALLLVRRRVLRIESGGFADGLAGDAAPDASVLRLSCPQRDEPLEVAVVEPDGQQAAAIEARLAELIGAPVSKKQPQPPRAA